MADKLEAGGIVEPLRAADLDRLPDLNVTDALQRVTGVQITRDRGEGGVAAVRGLTQVETLLNGREVFSAGTGRGLELADLPSEMLAGIDVWKTAPVQQVEGGLGGTINLRTRQPFDVAGDQAVASLRLLNGDLVEKARAQVSGLVIRRWRGSDGDWGLLLNLQLQQRAFREDNKSSGPPTARTDLLPGQTVYAPSAASETLSQGVRTRRAGSLVLGWRPAEHLQLQFEAHWAALRTRQDSRQINAVASSQAEPGSLQLFPGTQDLQRVTWLQAPVSVLSFARDTEDSTRQFALNAESSGPEGRLVSDLSHSRSRNTLLFSGPFMATTAPRFTQDLSRRSPATALAGADFSDPALYRFTGVAYRNRPFAGRLTAWRLDAEQDLDHPWWRQWTAGLRAAWRQADNGAGLVFGDVAVSGLTGADRPDLLAPGTVSPGARPGPSLSGWRVGDLTLARDPAALRAAYGITTPLPTEGNPLGRWRINERTLAGYASARWKAPLAPLSGELGLRWVQTGAAVDGRQSDPAEGDTDPLSVNATTTDWLPSLTLRHEDVPGRVWKAAASATITRPNFDQLSPSLSLLPNSVDPSLNQGSAGNPALRPVRSRNLDLAIEQALDAQSAWHATVFWKQVDGFINTVSSPEVHGGVTYQVSRPRNTAKATLTGAELGLQQSLPGLPAPWNGLGLQANYTYLASRAGPDSQGRRTVLQNLSRHSANLVVWYEQGDWAARLAWNWRSRFQSSQVNVVGLGTLPVYTAGYGWLDGSLERRLTPQVSLRLEALNLMSTLRQACYGSTTRPQGTWLNDRQLGLTLSARW